MPTTPAPRPWLGCSLSVGLNHRQWGSTKQPGVVAQPGGILGPRLAARGGMRGREEEEKEESGEEGMQTQRAEGKEQEDPGVVGRHHLLGTCLPLCPVSCVHSLWAPHQGPARRNGAPLWEDTHLGAPRLS